MRVSAVADLHGNLPELPAGDLAVIAGDVCPITNHDPLFQQRWLDERYYPWVERLPHAEVIWIAGNHDFVCQSEGFEPRGRAHYLCDTGIAIDGVSFHGIPWVPELHDWAFFAGREELAERCAQIAPGVDVIVSHGPPTGYGDQTTRGKLAGSDALLARIRMLEPALAVFGHIHEGYGRWELGPTTLANVAMVNQFYEVRPDAAVVFELP